MDNLTQEQRESVNNLWNEVVAIQQNQRGATLHTMMSETCKKLAEILPEDLMACRSYTTALIKSKNFQVALDFITSKLIGKELKFEHAYILHRMGRNQEALQVIDQVAIDADVCEQQIQHLKAQIQYKLFQYPKAMATYDTVLKTDLSPEDIIDILTNYLACQGSVDDVDLEKLENTLANFKVDKSYEYFFNLSQVYLKEKNLEKAHEALMQAHKLAKAEDGFDGSEEEARFKIQEMHFINQLYSITSNIGYATEKSNGNAEASCWFDFSKKIKNQILVEMNVTALSEVYSLNGQNLKDSIGSLSLKKFADRVKTQLKESTNLTKSQRVTMSINAIICLMKVNAIDEANAMITELKQKEQLSESEKALLTLLSVQGLIKDKKYSEAVETLQKHSDRVVDVKLPLMICHVQMLMKDQKAALITIMNFTKRVMTSTEPQNSAVLFSLALRLAKNYKQLELAEFKKFLADCVDHFSKIIADFQETGGEFVATLLDSLVSLGLNEVAFKLMNGLDHTKMQKGPIMGIYLNLLADQNMEKAMQITSRLDELQPSDLFAAQMVEEQGLTEDDCLQKLIEVAMPEKNKENKTQSGGNMQQQIGGAEVFIPKKRTKSKIHYPKGFDAANPGPKPDPERWLPKWQRSRFKKYAKKRGMNLKGAQGDALIDTDVTSGFAANTVKAEVVNTQSTNKRRRK